MEEGTDVCNVETTKRKLFEGSVNSDDGKAAKRPRLQVKIPRLKISEEQLKNLRKRSSKGESEPSIIRNEDDEKDVSTVNTSTAPSVSSAGAVSAATKATVSEQVTTVEESPVRHRLSNLLDGSSITPHHETAEQPEEEGSVESINCKGDSQLDNAERLSGPVSAQDNLFFSEGLLSFSDFCSPLLQEEDCITVPCYPDVVSKTCMQVSETAELTLSGDIDIEATASVITASEQDEKDREESHESQTSSNDPAANLLEDGPISGSATPGNCAAAEQLADYALPENKKDENVNAEEGSREMLESAEVKESAMDYASNYNTLEVMNTLLTSFTEEKRARTELEELVSQLEKKNQELVSECGKLRDLVNDLLPLSKVKNETVSRGIQINMDLSLRRGRAVDRATSPLRMMRSPSPDLALTSSSVGCQTVDGPEVTSTACQTDPLVRPSLPARPTIQTSTPARVQGIVMPNIQGRVQVPTNCTQASNPVQLAHNRPPPPYLKTHGQVEVARQLSVQSQQEQALKELMSKQSISAHHNTQQYPTNMLHAAGYNSTGYQSGTLNVSATGQYVQPPNRFVEISSLVAAQATGNQTLERTDLNAFSDVHYTGNQRSAINVSSLSAQQANSPALTQLLTQNQLMAQHNLPVSNRTLSSAPSTLYNTRPSQYMGTQQHSNQQQVTSAGTSQVTARSQSAAIRHKTNMILQFINERRRQIAVAQSLRNSEQLSGTSLPSMACNQVATQQHTEASPLHHLMSQSQVSQVTQQHVQPNPLTLRNSPQPLGTFSSSTMAYNQVNAHHHTGLTLQQFAQSQASQVTQWIAQPNPASSSNSQQTFAFPPSRMAYNQVATQQRSDRLQHQVSQPDISQAQLHAQPNPTSMQQDSVNSMIRHQSDQNPPPIQTANSNSHLIRNLLDNALHPSARSQVEAQSLSNEVQLVYNELQKSLDETTSLAKQKQSSTSQASRPSETQLDQLETSKNRPCNEQPPKATLNSQPVPSKSEQSVVHCYQTPANQFNCQDASQVSASEPVMEMPHSNTNLSEARSKRSVHFSQEANSSEPMDVSSRNENSANHLDASDCTDQSSLGQQESHHSFTDKDPYKAPPKTPSGALEDAVKRLLALQDKIAGTEDSDNGCEPSADLTESRDDTSQLTTALESQHSEQEVETTGERNQSNPTEDTDKDTNHYNTQQEVKMTSSVLEDEKIVDENEIEHFPMTEGDQDSAAVDGQENSVSDQPDSLEASSPGLNTVGQDKDKQVTSGDENDSSFQDIYMDLMSPVIPRMSVARRFRPHTHAHSPEDDCDADTSMSSKDASNKNEDNANDDETEDNLEDSQPETSSLCSAVPSDDTNCNQQENEKDTERINNEQEDEVDGEEGVSMSSDNTPVGAVDDATEQAVCTPKPHEETRTHLGEEQLATETEEGNPLAPAPVPSVHLKFEASYAPCMNEVVYKNNKVGKKEQREACELNPGAIPKQDLFQETATVGDIKVAEKIPLLLEKGSEQIIPSSLVKGSLDGSSRIIDSNMNLEHSKMLIAASNQPSNTALLPVPRLALRVVNGNTVIMWDLPPDNNITEINFFEVYVYLIKKDAERQQKRGGRWIKIGEMKAMPLPMACTIRHLIQKKVVYFFIVRAISHNGVPGPYSKPCCVACS